MKTSTLVKDLGFNGKAHWKHYRMEPPIEQRDYEDSLIAEHKFVIVSGADVMFSGPETYIFAADSEGSVTGWAELEGSFKGGIDHDAALVNAGYEVSS